MSAPSPNPEEPLPWPRWYSWLAIFAACMMVGLLRFTYFHLGDLNAGDGNPWQARMIDEMEGGFTFFLLVPAMLWMARRVPFERGRKARALLLHGLAVVAISATATTIHLLVRCALYPRFGLRAYAFGPLPLRYAMESPNDLITYATVVLAVLWSDSRRRARRRAVVTARMETQLARLQLQNLRLQLQPHFLFNTLNMISSVMYEDVAQADAMLTRLCDLLRYTLSAPDRQEISLEEEIRILRLYLDILQARFGERLQVRFEIEPEALGGSVPQLLLQPLAENAIRYGADRESTRVELVMRARREGDALTIGMRDHGPGFGAALASMGHGVGLRNTRERLASLYGDRQAMICRDAADGDAEVILQLPWRMAEEGTEVGPEIAESTTGCVEGGTRMD